MARLHGDQAMDEDCGQAQRYSDRPALARPNASSVRGRISGGSVMSRCGKTKARSTDAFGYVNHYVRPHAMTATARCPRNRRALMLWVCPVSLGLDQPFLSTRHRASFTTAPDPAGPRPFR